MDDSRQPLISVVIPTTHGKTLSRCLSEARRALAEFPHEIIVVPDEGRGVSEARNQGLRQAQGQFFLLMDDDCILESPTLVRNLLDRATMKNTIHGGCYELGAPASYWAKTYALVTDLWLKNGRDSGGSHTHLLGGFIFGSETIKKKVVFANHLTWGGEEKELLLRLAKTGITGRLHPDLKVIHIDNSGLRKFVKRAFLQGLAAGTYDLHTPLTKIKTTPSPLQLWPGLVLFFVLSRIGILFGKLKIALTGKAKIAESSPAA